MDPSSKPSRVTKTAAQIKVLNEKFEAGMVTTREKAMVAEAVSLTDLTTRQVEDWIGNKRRPHRSATKKRAAEYNNYTAFLACSATGFNGNGKDIGSLTKRRAEEYNDLKKTAEGRKFLHENKEKMNKANGEALTTAQKHGRALGLYSNVKGKSDKLESLGYKAVTLISQPDGQASVLGSQDAVNFFKNRMKVTQDFMKYVGDTEVQHLHDTRPVLCHRLRVLFNKAYAAAVGREYAVMPYASIQRGLQLTVEGLPDGLGIRPPDKYTQKQMAKILECESSFKVHIRQEGADISTTCTAETLEGEGSVVPGMQAVVSSSGRSHVVPSAQAVGTHADAESMANSMEEGGEETMHETGQNVDAGEYIFHIENVQLPEDNRQTWEEGQGITSIDHQSPAEAMRRAQQLAEQIVTKSATKSDRKRKRGKQSLVGRKIQHLWTVPRPGRPDDLIWYDGVITEQSNKEYQIKYDDEDEVHKMSVTVMKNFLKKKTLILI